MTIVVTLTDLTVNIPLVYNAANDYYFKMRYGARIAASESRPMWHEPDGLPPELIELVDQNNQANFTMLVQNKASTYPSDDVLDALTTLSRWVDGANQQAARYWIKGDVKPIYIKVQRDNSSVPTYWPIIYGSVDDSQAHMDSQSVLNDIAYNVVLSLTLAPYGDAETRIELANLIPNANFEIEGSTSGLAAGWNKAGTPTTTLDTDIKLFGAHSQKVVATADDHGVYCDTVANGSDTTAAGCIYIHVASGTVEVYLRDVTGAVWVDFQRIDATDSNSVSDKSVTDEGGRTWWRVPVVETSLTAGNDVQIGAVAYNGAATFYLNGAYLETGRSDVPDAWSSYRTIRNRGDADATNPEYVNWVDVWGVPGDAPAGLDMYVSGPSGTDWKNAIGGHRIDGKVIAADVLPWVYLDDLSSVSNFVETNGAWSVVSSRWRFTASGGVGTGFRAGRINSTFNTAFLQALRGQRRVMIGVKTDDATLAAQVRFRLEATYTTTPSYITIATGEYYNPIQTTSLEVADGGLFNSPIAFDAIDTYSALYDFWLGVEVAAVPDTKYIEIEWIWFVDTDQFLTLSLLDETSSGIYILGDSGEVVLGYFNGAAEPNVLSTYTHVIPGKKVNRYALMCYDANNVPTTTADIYTKMYITPRTRHLLGTV